MIQGTAGKKKKVRSVIVFGIIEFSILILFLIFVFAAFFGVREVANKRSRQLVEDSYRGLTEELVQDLKNVSQAGYALLNNETVIRLKTYYYDLVLEDSYARNTALNQTIAQMVSLVSYYNILDACALWIAPNSEAPSYNTMYTFVGDDTRRALLDGAIGEHVFSAVYEQALKNRGGKITATLSLSENNDCILALLLDTDFFVNRLSLVSVPETETAYAVRDGELCILCNTKGVNMERVFSLDGLTERPILKSGRILYYTRVAGVLPVYTELKTSALDQSLPVYLISCLISFVLLCVIAVVFLIIFHHFFHRPVERMLSAMGEVSRGNFDVRIDETISSDFQYVYDGFNFMTSSINGYIEENYRQRVMRTESEFKALQAQINPHFLYNCFANIRSLCKMGDVESVERMTDSLSKLFLYVTRNAQPVVTLKDELENVRHYLDIQRIRFGDRVKLELGELPERYAAQKIPKLCLQPIAENAYKYVFAEIERGGILRLSFEEKEGAVLIVTEDNGANTTDEEILRIRKALEESEETSGLVNVARRLEHYAEGKGKLTVQRSSLGGLAVRIELRIDEEEQNV